MNASFKLVNMLGYSQVFDDDPKSILDYLSGMGRQRLVTVLVGLIPFSNKNSKFQSPREFIEMFFEAENNQIANDIFDSVIKHSKNNPSKEFTLISTESVLYLLEFAYDNIKVEEILSNREFEINLFKALLVQNDILFKKQDVAIRSVENVDQKLKLAALSIANTFPNTDILNYDIIEVLVSQIVKSVSFFEFLELKLDTTKLLDEFYSQVNVKNWKEYFQRLLPIIMSSIVSAEEIHTNVSIPKDGLFEENCKFLDKLSIFDSDLLTDFDFRKVRSKPLLKIDEGAYKVLYRLFLAEVLHKGLYFKISEINRNLSSTNIKEFRGYYCDEFSEKYLFYKQLKYIFKNRYIEFSGEEMKKGGLVAEPDYYVRNGNKIFLFESKDVLISAQVKSSYDFSLYETELKKRFLRDGKQNKAVLQLINNVKRILKYEFSFDYKYDALKVRIYPILVLHDHQFNVPGLNYIINEWFQNEVQELGRQGFNITKVQPLLIIEMGSLILHQEVFREKRVVLDEVIDQYFKFIGNEKNPLNSLEPFANFATRLIRDKGKSRIPKVLLDLGLKLFE
ncbi:hypothetical protein [Algoriphagus halophytocola]|uniref:NERD domain-containing protein n=1 Tax=Algoriphagus halophytocola TaxID=2991499 RepID=A0ABY6ML91_9BACT|nr:hypothetical protein [Algoriphagus sp. TR-M5]UZD22974.1 hypothetical protein OM944_00465 [Algoriphagus sp. TR-M5]